MLCKGNPGLGAVDLNVTVTKLLSGSGHVDVCRTCFRLGNCEAVRRIAILIVEVYRVLDLLFGTELANVKHDQQVWSHRDVTTDVAKLFDSNSHGDVIARGSAVLSRNTELTKAFVYPRLSDSRVDAAVLVSLGDLLLRKMLFTPFTDVLTKQLLLIRVAII